ncbi:polysaccharide biosynthesis/export family protein [Occallatibacter riparius]|uniref:SLBB domain-containing protein n=1 Tax=Occallatibacter riparius TaxID=1002689 RepID=A0A9J7BKB6_9BACT|nr:polysaccharide biosynthesis/export family protein [Occallatibacter riparius]UWZ82889.1 SLBB domain-containing protein [Occallatibacter riparius]
MRRLLDHWRLFSSVLGSLLLLCLLYCLFAPKQYEAKTRLALRIGPVSALNLDTADTPHPNSLAAGEIQLETLANVLRSDELAWRVILEKKLYESPGFVGVLPPRFSPFHADSPSPDARAWLLERFQNALHVRTVPRTMLFELRFQSRDPNLSAGVLNALVRAYQSEETETRILATTQATGWLNTQLQDLKAKADRDEQRLADFQNQHGLLIAPDTPGNSQSGGRHVTALLEVDELGRDLVAATSERILREAEYRAAMQGDPELVLASDPRLQNDNGGLSVSALRQIRQRRGDLEQERAQLSAEHGPNFPRVVEIRQQLDDLDRQQQAEDAKLRDRFRSAFQTASDREQLVRSNLAQRTGEGQQVVAAAAQYEGMRREAEASRELYVRMLGKVEEAGLAAGVHVPELWVIDPAHPPAKPSAPDLPLYMAITFFAGLWIATGAVYLVRIVQSSRMRYLLAALLLASVALTLSAQAPTPSTSGLPTGVVKIPAAKDTKNYPNPKEAPPVWTGTDSASTSPAAGSLAPLAGPIVPGEQLEITEYHTPEFHSSVRVAADGTVMLPMIGEIHLAGLDESEAARVIADTLIGKGMLLHPQVTVQTTAYVGQDVTILGEVGRPGVYPFAAHHRLLDLISAASGLNVTAGGLVDITHRDHPDSPEMITLDFSQSGSERQNPELLPGDLVHVSRAGLVYVVGDVNRPGGFTLDPAQRTTVLQALSLAWGPSQNASLSKALLIHAKDDGRTVTTLDLKRMLRGQDPDLPVNERDILFVPDSTAKNLWNRTMESAIQSAVGVSIYAGMVYSQRF